MGIVTLKTSTLQRCTQQASASISVRGLKTHFNLGRFARIADIETQEAMAALSPYRKSGGQSPEVCFGQEHTSMGEQQVRSNHAAIFGMTYPFAYVE